jgi:hypothetical protein
VALITAVRRAARQGRDIHLNHHVSYVHWHFFQMSMSNVIVIALMFVVCAPGTRV